MLLAGLAAGVAGPAAQARAAPGSERLIVARVNALRVSHGLTPLAEVSALSASALAFAQHMARHDAYGHGADGRTAAQRVQAAGYRHCVVAENIAWQHSSRGLGAAELARRLAEGWERSPGHRRNLLDADVTDTGVAVARSAASGRYYAVQLLARPAWRRLQFRLSNDGASPLAYRFDGQAHTLAPRSTATHEHCRAAELSLHPAGQPAPTVLQPTDGAHYRVGPVGSARGPLAGGGLGPRQGTRLATWPA